jgi:diketogulonate reductase-like aldo/keto reductase
VYVHNAWDLEPMESYINGLCDVVDKGLAKNIGVSNFTLEQLKQAVSISRYPIIAIQVLYNILERSVVTEDLIEFCKNNHITIVAYRPVERKKLADRNENSLVVELAKKYEKTPAQIAINWLISQENVVAIPKSLNKEHIDENLGALEFDLSAEDYERLNRIIK